MLSTLSPPTRTTTTSFTPHHSQAPSSPSPEPQNGLQQLVQEIKDYLGTSSGINSEDIDPSHLKALMNKYVSNPSDWARYAIADPSKNYTRNAVENINGKANILILVWNPQKGSPVHDHANAHCVMKILSGSLKEEIFSIPSPDSVPGTPLETKRETSYGADQVTYISDNIGLHRISNPCEGELAVSLHLYTPPNAADYGYHIYDEKTGQSKFCKQAKATLPPKM